MQTTDRAGLLSKIAESSQEQFGALALEVFRYQAPHNPLYGRYLQLLGRNPELVRSVVEIPFLPVSLFKKYTIQTGAWEAQTVFTSSGTSGQLPSQHLVRDLNFYLENTSRGFSQFYGDPADWCMLALLPAYLERQGSSLVAMADFFIQKSRYPESGFFLHDLEKLQRILIECRQKRIPTLLLGVSFALLDFAERYPMDLSGVVVMETGGMKGRRKEMTRAELHQALCRAFQLPGIHSEYGMTELFSQAYCQPANAGDSTYYFKPAPTLRAMTTELNDPFCPAAPGRPGLLQFIDLANVDTCSFIATEDIGKVYPDGCFEVLGRSDAAEMRGCNLMVE